MRTKRNWLTGSSMLLYKPNAVLGIRSWSHFFYQCRVIPKIYIECSKRFKWNSELLCVWVEPAVLGSTETALKFKYANKHTTQCMGQDISLQSEKKKGFKPWFNIFADKFNCVCHSIRSMFRVLWVIQASPEESKWKFPFVGMKPLDIFSHSSHNEILKKKTSSSHQNWHIISSSAKLSYYL